MGRRELPGAFMKARPAPIPMRVQKLAAPRLGCEDFGRALIESLDLDPEYVAIHEAVAVGDIDRGEHARLLLSFWLFYHFGAAAYVADIGTLSSACFWGRCLDPGVPRFAARRYFRGPIVEKVVGYLQNRYGSPESAVNDLCRFEGYSELTRRIMEWPSFGPMVAFKAADMIEATGYAPVQGFTSDEFYDAPREGARLYAPQESTSAATRVLLDRLGPIFAPPRYARWIGVQEAETIFCKWKSHLKGKYDIGRDLEAMQGELQWREGTLAIKLGLGLKRALRRAARGLP